MLLLNNREDDWLSVAGVAEGVEGFEEEEEESEVEAEEEDEGLCEW